MPKEPSKSTKSTKNASNGTYRTDGAASSSSHTTTSSEIPNSAMNFQNIQQIFEQLTVAIQRDMELEDVSESDDENISDTDSDNDERCVDDAKGDDEDGDGDSDCDCDNGLENGFYCRHTKISNNNNEQSTTTRGNVTVDDVNEDEEDEDEDEDEDDDENDVKYNRHIATNPFYDKDADDQDEYEYHQQYVRRFGKDLSSIDLFTDATLTCPMCFNILTEFCQQHEEYHQWRAVFVQNCYVHRIESDNTSTHEEPEYRRVDCMNCGTEVCALDQDGVYHFFHVIANESTLPEKKKTNNNEKIPVL
jgi:hypothetical protein